MEKRRKFLRLAREYRVEYGPLSALFSGERLKTAIAKNISGGGVLFSAHEELAVGSKIVLSIYVSGWTDEDGSLVPADDPEAELHFKVIAEIVRVERDDESGDFRIGARFVGRVRCSPE